MVRLYLVKPLLSTSYAKSQLKQEQAYVSLKSDIYLCNTGTYSSWMFDSVAANRDRISQIIYSQIPNVYIDYKYQGFE